jgi:hypothetical protein
VERKIRALPPSIFKRQYRLCQQDFYELLSKIAPDISTKNRKLNKISPVVKLLAVTLRWLAGGCYLDLSFEYEMIYKTIYKYYYQVIIAIDKNVLNINFPLGDELALRALEAGFMRVFRGTCPDTVAAGDGVVFKMDIPNAIEANGDVSSFYTRKGYFAYGMQGFCDSNCKFLSISMKCCSSTHDSTAYIISSLAIAIREGKLVEWAHMVLDEAYPCNNQELSSWKGKNLPHLER